MSQIERTNRQRENLRAVCYVCGKRSTSTICDTCAERLRVDALARKKHEEQGNSWSHWSSAKH